MIVIIDGWWGSGKSTLRGLLDGHPQLFVSPIQDGIFGGFAGARTWQSVLDSKDISEFRKVLCGLAEYNRIEKDALVGSVFNAASGESWDFGRFTFDFYAFDRAYMGKVMALEVWDTQTLVELLYETMTEYWKESHGAPSSLSGYVSMDNNLGPTAEFIINNTKDVKYIWVDRPSADIVSVHKKRKPVEGNLGTKDWGKKSVRSLIRSGYVLRHERRRKELFELQEGYPDRVKVVGLADLVENTSDTMPRIADFLGIEALPILNRYTYGGLEFPGSDKYIGTLNDTAASILTEHEMRMIRSEAKALQRGIWSPKNNIRKVKRAVRALVHSFSSEL